MDKRWRNLGVLVLVVVVILLLFFGISAFLPKSFDKVLTDNSLSKADFSYSISSISKPLPDKVHADLLVLSSSLSGKEKEYLIKVLDADTKKKEIVQGVTSLFEVDLVSFCNSSEDPTQELTDKVYSLDSSVEELANSEQQLGVDINYSIFETQRQGYVDIVVELEETCAEIAAEEAAFEVQQESEEGLQ